jgi:hypothetical protein
VEITSQARTPAKSVISPLSLDRDFSIEKITGGETNKRGFGPAFFGNYIIGADSGDNAYISVWYKTPPKWYQTASQALPFQMHKPADGNASHI